MDLGFIKQYHDAPWKVGLVIFLLLGCGALIIYAVSSQSVQPFRPAQLLGTVLMLSCLPAFLLASLIYLHRETLALIAELKPDSEQPSVDRLLKKVAYLRPWVLLLIILSMLFGLYQNDLVLRQMLRGDNFSAIDLGIVMGNSILWACIGLVMGWRLPVSLELMHFGRHINIDLYRIEPSHPLANLAAKDVLVIAGAMAFMPLQSLDAEFRWVNYEAGLYVGIPSALILLIVPLLGLRKNTIVHKETRLTQIGQQIDTTDEAEIERLEVLSAHAERISGLSNWPFNMRLATKIIGYAIIAPLAWVGAALVENIVDSLTG